MNNRDKPEAEEPKNGKIPQWNKPRFKARMAERRRMVEKQIERRGVADQDVLAAMQNVPRHLFVPEEKADDAYSDHPLPIGGGQTISQPYIVAVMTERLNIQPGDRVLEIGTGSGYQAAVLSEITPHIFSSEIDEKLTEEAKQRLQKLGYRTIRVRHSEDGLSCWEEEAPFDAIIVTCAARRIPDPLKRQLKAGGRMIIPVGGSLMGAATRACHQRRQRKSSLQKFNAGPIRSHAR